MRNISITEKVYDQLKSLAEEHGEVIEVVACAYLERGMSELDRIQDEINSAKAETAHVATKLEKLKMARVNVIDIHNYRRH